MGGERECERKRMREGENEGRREGGRGRERWRAERQLETKIMHAGKTLTHKYTYTAQGPFCKYISSGLAGNVVSTVIYTRA